MDMSLNGCRLCLKDGTLMSIFDRDENDFVIYDKIKICSGVDLKFGPNYSTSICEKCRTDLNTSYEFRRMCIESNSFLQSNIKSDPDEEGFDLPYEEETYLDFSAESLELEDEAQSEDIRIETPPKIRRGRKRLVDVEYQRVYKKRKSKIIDLICEICGNKFPTRTSFLSHMKWHEKKEKYSCEICGKKFVYNTSQLTRHMRIHTGEKPFSCEFCKRCFNDRGTLIAHRRTHTGERPFKCETCGKAFTYSNVLRKHILIHTGEKAFPCEPCSKRFYTLYHLQQHCKTIKHLAIVKETEREDNMDEIQLIV